LEGDVVVVVVEGLLLELLLLILLETRLDAILLTLLELLLELPLDSCVDSLLDAPVVDSLVTELEDALLVVDCDKAHCRPLRQDLIILFQTHFA
jgi:hypothetical protein